MAEAVVPLGVDTGIASLVRTGKGFRGYSEAVTIPPASTSVVWMAGIANPANSGMVIRLEKLIVSTNTNCTLQVTRGIGAIYSGGTVVQMANTGGLSTPSVATFFNAATTPIALAGSPLPTVHMHSFISLLVPTEFISNGQTLLQPGQTVLWGAAPMTALSTGQAIIVVQTVEYPVGLP